MRNMWTCFLSTLALSLTCLAIAAVSGEWRVNLLSGSSTIATLKGATQEAAWITCQAEIAKRSVGETVYTCQTPRYVAKVTATETCSTPQPPAESQSVACPEGGSWTQTRTYSAAPYPTCWTAGAWQPTSPPAGACSSAPPPVTTGRFTDLASAPSCARVTIYPEQKVVSAAEAGIPIHQGRCLEVWPDSDTDTAHPKLKATWASVRPGDVVYVHGGTYSKVYGEATWKLDSNLDTRVSGTATQPIALVGYPGEVARFVITEGHENFAFADGNGAKAHYITLANLHIENPSSCITAGGDTSTDTKPESGGDHIRIVAIDCMVTNASANTMTGMISIQGDAWTVLGSAFHDPGNRTVINNNHVIYIQNGSDDVEIAYNQFVNLHVGFVVQIHQDGTPMLYERIKVHDNYFEAAKPSDMRGVTTSNIQTASTVTWANNTFKNLGGGGWGCINAYAGQITITGNVCLNTQNGVVVNGQTSQSRRITMDRNQLCPASGYSRLVYENGAAATQLTETNPIGC